MKFWIFSADNSGAMIAMRLILEGQQVSYTLIPTKGKKLNPDDYKVLDGTRVQKVGWNRNLSIPRDTLVVFDTNHNPEYADSLRARGLRVFGSGKFAARLEDDRSYGLDIMTKCGIPTSKENVNDFYFKSVDQAVTFLKGPGRDRAWVVKPDHADCAYTFVSNSNDELIGYMQAPKVAEVLNRAPFTIQEKRDGIATSCEGWFDGSKFVLFNITLENKRKGAGNVGRNRGCRGDVTWIADRNIRLVKEGISRIEPILRQNKYVGFIDLNQMVSKEGIFGLEWTPRFGYNGTFTFIGECIQKPLWSVIEGFLDGKLDNLKPSSKFGASVNLDREVEIADLPIICDKTKDPEIGSHVWLYDFKCGKQGQVLTAGAAQEIAVVCAGGTTIPQAKAALYKRVEAIDIPDMDYRVDIGDDAEKEYQQLRSWGWIGQRLGLPGVDALTSL